MFIKPRIHKLFITYTYSCLSCSVADSVQDHRTLDLSATSADDLESWKASFLRAGVYPEYIKDESAPEETYEEEATKESNDPQLERQGTGDID